MFPQWSQTKFVNHYQLNTDTELIAAYLTLWGGGNVRVGLVGSALLSG